MNKMIELKGKYNQDCKIFLSEVEDGVEEMVKDILNHQVSEGVQVRIMPDTHVGKGIVIGFTKPITSMVNPNYIGVDIGCSVTTHRLNKRLDVSNFKDIDKRVRRCVPMGRATLNRKSYKDWWLDEYFEKVNERILKFQLACKERFGEEKKRITIDREAIVALCQKLNMKEDSFYHSVGSLGGGNHFIEFGESENSGAHYATIHSGSRNFGNRVCQYHAAKMIQSRDMDATYQSAFKEIVEHSADKTTIPNKLRALREEYNLDKKETLLQGDAMYLYLVDMIIAQTYAEFNHKVMSKAIFRALGDDYFAEETIHSMHNFIDTTDWIIRKGAIRSYVGEKMLIPFNMRDGILICEGKSNADWNFSAPHGAGRILGRNQAFKTLDMAEFTKEMEGIYSTSVCKATLDESPMAYKDKDLIIDAIADTATIIDSVKPILNIKALN